MIIAFLQNHLAFMIAAFMVCLAPGPDIMLTLFQSALYGFKTGFAITLGLCSGLFIHTTIVVLGVAVLFSQYPIAYDILLWFGFFYLLYLAWVTWNTQPNAANSNSKTRMTYWKFYIRGFIMNVSNPKISIFFLAFLPQFTDKTGENTGVQLSILGLIFIIIAMCVFSSVALGASHIGALFERKPHVLSIMHKVTSGCFVIVALQLLVYSFLLNA